MRRTVPGLLAAGSLVMLGSLIVGGVVAETAFALTAVLFPVALIVLGTRRARPALRAALAALAAILALSAAGVLLLSGRTPADDIVLGLPLAAWLSLLGLGLAPFVLVVWSHAATFDPPRQAGRARHDG